MESTNLQVSKILPTEIYSMITDLRTSQPDLSMKLARARRRREDMTKDGKLTVFTTDQPARGITEIAEDPLRLANRHEFLARMLRVVASSPFDGFSSSPDTIDDLFLLEHLARKRGGPAFLDDKILFGSVNRGGLAGSVFELDDRPTAYDVEGILSMHLDAAKFLLRVDLNERDSGRLLESCAQVLRECSRHKLPVFIEPVPVKKVDGKFVNDDDPERLIRLVGAAAGLGSSSNGHWLMLPHSEEFARAAHATSLPILLLGGDIKGRFDKFFVRLESVMKSSTNVRGILIGGSLAFPDMGDPLGLATAIHAIVHEGTTAKAAVKIAEESAKKRSRLFNS